MVYPNTAATTDSCVKLDMYVLRFFILAAVMGYIVEAYSSVLSNQATRNIASIREDSLYCMSNITV